MKLEVPEQLHSIAQVLHQEGYRYSEAYPIQRWKAKGWPTDDRSFKVVDALLALFRAL